MAVTSFKHLTTSSYDAWPVSRSPVMCKHNLTPSPSTVPRHFTSFQPKFPTHIQPIPFSPRSPYPRSRHSNKQEETSSRPQTPPTSYRREPRVYYRFYHVHRAPVLRQRCRLLIWAGKPSECLRRDLPRASKWRGRVWGGKRISRMASGYFCFIDAGCGSVTGKDADWNMMRAPIASGNAASLADPPPQRSCPRSALVTNTQVGE